MSEHNTLVKRLDQLGEEIRDRESIVGRVMSEIEMPTGSSTTELASQERPSRGRWIAALVMAACILLALGYWPSRPSTLYAQTVAALNKAQTVHVVGWTSRLIRKWPLEQALKNDGANRHDFEAWYWADNQTPRSYETFGPVTQFRYGERLQEYQQDVDLLFVADVNEKDHLERFSSMADYFRVLKSEGAKSEDLGTRVSAGKTLRGYRFDRHGRKSEYWFDAKSDLPISLKETWARDGQSTVGVEMQFSYNQKIPDTVVSYKPPKAKNVRYGGSNENVQLAWRRHVQEIEVRRDQHSSNDEMVLFPREGRQTFSFQYTKTTPNEPYVVVPLDLHQYSRLTVRDFVRLRASTDEGEFASETWRVDKDLLDVEFPRSDLVCHAQVPAKRWTQFALNQIGLEYVDVEEDRTYWIVKCREDRKPTKLVEPPVPYIVEGGKVKRGLVKPGVGHRLRPVTMYALLEDFNRLQNTKLTASHPVLVDETGIRRAPKWSRDEYATFDEFAKAVDYDQYYVATDAPYFHGKGSAKMARDWYEQELGLTVTEETRKATIHVVRRKE